VARRFEAWAVCVHARNYSRGAKLSRRRPRPAQVRMRVADGAVSAAAATRFLRLR
jgi:hypothetical protein